MKLKQLILPVVAIVTVGIAYVSYNHSSPNGESSLVMQNIEALADGEEDCRFINGYSIFTGSTGGAYDCCKIWRDNLPEYSSRCD